MPVSSTLCIITPTHRGDLGQFTVLRRSVRLFAPHLQHIAIVNTEDRGLFQEHFGAEPRLEIVESATVLPRAIEARRRKSGPRWLTGRWLHGRRIKGWLAQQLMKLHALADCSHEAAVFVDSDVFFCRPLAPDYFFVDGRLKLFRRPALNAEALDFDISTHDIMGNPLHLVTDLYDYIYSPACFRKSTAQTLFQELIRRKRSTWERRFVAQIRPSEYNLLGYAATVLEQCAGYHLVDCNPEDLHHSIRFPEDRVRLDAEIEQMRCAAKNFVLIQSRLGIEIERITQAFDSVARAHL